MTHWCGVTKGGILVASLYAYTGPDAEARNADLINLVARQLAAVRLPFVIGGDWNTSPQALAETGFPQRLRAFVATAGVASYISAGAASELDYFVISKVLKPGVCTIKVLDGTNVPKHSPVEITFSGKPRSDTVLTLARPPRRPPGNPLTGEPDPLSPVVSPDEAATFAGSQDVAAVTQAQLTAWY